MAAAVGYVPKRRSTAIRRISCCWPTAGFCAPTATLVPNTASRAVLSDDGGESRDVEQTLVIAGDLASRRLGHPCTLQAAPGRLVPVKYAHGDDGVISIRSTCFRLRDVVV
jgi:hypothetical protein